MNIVLHQPGKKIPQSLLFPSTSYLWTQICNSVCMKSGNIRKYATGLYIYIFGISFFLFISFIYLTELGLPLSSCNDQGLLQLQWAGFPLWWLLRARGLGAAASVTVVQGLSCSGVFLDQGQILYHWTTPGKSLFCVSLSYYYLFASLASVLLPRMLQILQF